MYILISTYVRPIEEVDRELPRHREWLRELYAAGRVLVSGRRSPATGGAIVLRASSREELDALLETDPYVRAGVVDYEIVAFDETGFPHRSAGFDSFAAAPATALP